MSTFNCPRCDAENDIESALCAKCGLSFSDPQQSGAGLDQLLPAEDQDRKQASPGREAAEEPPQESGEIDEDAVPGEPSTRDDLDDWLKGLPSPSAADLGKVGEKDDIDGSLPTWLQEVRVTADKKGPAGETGFVDWLNELEGDKPETPESGEELPDWVSALTNPEQWPETEDAESMAEWFEESEGTDELTMPKTSELPGTQPLKGSRELDGVPDQLVGDSLPNWLMHEAGVDSGVTSAEYRPDDEESTEFRQSTESPTMDRYDSANDIDKVKESAGWLDEGAEDVIELPRKPKIEDASTAISRPVEEAADRWGWLEEFEDRQVDVNQEAMSATPPQPVDEEDVGELLADKTHSSLTGIGRVASQEEIGIPEPAEELETYPPFEQLDIPAQPEEPEILAALEDLEIPKPAEEEEIQVSIEEFEIPSPREETAIESQPRDLELEEMLLAGVTAQAVEDTGEPEIAEDWQVALEEALGSRVGQPAEVAMEAGETEIQPAEIPDWLAAAKPDEVKSSALQTAIEIEESTGPLTGLKGVIPLAATATGAGQVAAPAAYQVTKEHQEQVALLRQLTIVQPDPVDAKSDGGEKDQLFNGRILMTLLLVLVILAGWFVPGNIWPSFMTSWKPTKGTIKVYETIDQAAGNNVLIAFEYTPAMSGELDVIAESILQRLAANGSHVLTISQAAAGVIMADQALERAGVEDALQIGLLPGDAVGLRGLANCLDQSGPCRSVVNIPMQSDAGEQLADVGLLVILASDRDSLVNWIEQVGVYSDIPVVAGLTQSLSPVAVPYVTNNQLAGIIDGAPASISYDYSRDAEPEQAGQILASLTLAQWLFVALLILGVLYFGLFRRSTSGSRRTRTR